MDAFAVEDGEVALHEAVVAAADHALFLVGFGLGLEEASVAAEFFGEVGGDAFAEAAGVHAHVAGFAENNRVGVVKSLVKTNRTTRFTLPPNHIIQPIIRRIKLLRHPLQRLTLRQPRILLLKTSPKPPHQLLKQPQRLHPLRTPLIIKLGRINRIIIIIQLPIRLITLLTIPHSLHILISTLIHHDTRLTHHSTHLILPRHDIAHLFVLSFIPVKE